MNRFHPPTLRELGRRARRLRLVVSDVDGVLTDGGVFHSETGDAYRRYCVRDGVGVERLREHDITTAFIGETMPHSPVLRAEELALARMPLGIADKASELLAITRSSGCSLSEVAYIGDDTDDLEAMRLLAPYGLVAVPYDAAPEVLRIAHHRCATAGGLGAFREFAEWLLRHRRLALAGSSHASNMHMISAE